MDDCEIEVLLYEFKADLNKYLTALGPRRAGALAGGSDRVQPREQEREMPFFGQELLLSAEKKGPLTTPAYRAALAKCRALARAQGIDAVMHAIQARRARRADRRPGVDDRSRQRRSLQRRELDAGGGRGLSEHHRAGRRGLRPAGGHVVHRQGVDGAEADRARLRVRAGDQAPASATVQSKWCP